MKHSIRARDVYRHFKGTYYRVIGVAEHTETGETLVIYQALDNLNYPRIWARPLDMFCSEVDKEKYPDTKQKYRFSRVVRDTFPEED